MNTKDGVGFGMIRRAATQRLVGSSRFANSEAGYLAVIDRYMHFYDLDILEFLSEIDIERFISYEWRVVPGEELPFGMSFGREARWVGALKNSFIRIVA